MDAKTKPVIPEVVKRLSGIHKNQLFIGYRISPAAGGRVRYDDCGMIFPIGYEIPLKRLSDNVILRREPKNLESVST